MKEYTVRFRQTFEAKLEVNVEASSEKAAIAKAKKLSRTFCNPEDADFCREIHSTETEGDDFQVVDGEDW